MDEKTALEKQLETYQRVQAHLEQQKAAFGLYTPPYIQLGIEDNAEKIRELKEQLKNISNPQRQAVWEYFERVLAEFEQYKDTEIIVMPSLKPGMIKRRRGARTEEKELEEFISNRQNSAPTFKFRLNPKYSPRYPDLLSPDEEAQPEELEAFLIANKRVVLLGDPGAGKSTSLRSLFRLYTQRWETGNSEIIPVFAALNRWQEGTHLIHFLLQEAREIAEKLPDLLKDGKLLLLLDGLNELPGFKLEAKTHEIIDPRSKEIAALKISHSKAICLLSCRVKEFAGGPEWRDLHVLPLTREQIDAIIKAYFEEEAVQAERLIAELYDEKQEKVRTLAEKPFYLRRLLAYFGRYQEIPQNPALLLDYSVTKALDEETTKGLLKPKGWFRKPKKKLIERLGLLAFNLIKADRVSTSVEQAIVWLWHLRRAPNRKNKGIKEPELSLAEQQAAELWLKQGEGAGFVVITGEVVNFSHQLLRDYFCACFLRQQGLAEKWLHRSKNWQFREVWQIWVGLESGIVNTLIFKLKKNKDDAARTTFAHILGQIGNTAVEPLLSELKVGNSEMRYYSIIALGETGDPRVIEPLITALEDKYSEVRWIAVDALGNIGDARAVEPLITVLSDVEWDVREWAAYALGQIGQAKAVLPLITALEDVDSSVRSQSAYALEKIGDPRALVDLEHLSQQDSESSVRAAAAAAVERIRAKQHEV